jgi:hypothetical protein
MHGLEFNLEAGSKYKGWNEMYGLELNQGAGINYKGCKCTCC